MIRTGVFVAVVLFCCSPPTYASPSWMGTYHYVGGVYAYGEADTLSVFLDGVQCANQKNYYHISPVYVNNAKQLIAMILTAKASGKRVRFFEDSTIDTIGCYIKGVWVED